MFANSYLKKLLADSRPHGRGLRCEKMNCQKTKEYFSY